MRSLFVLVAIIFCFSLSSVAQDQIVTIKGDTFECKITKVDTRYIHFDYDVGDIMRSTVIPLDKVASYEKGVYQAKKKTIVENDAERFEKALKRSSSSTNQNLNSESSEEGKPEDVWRPVRLAFNIGYSHMTAGGTDDLSSDLKAYEDALRSGWHMGATLDFFINNEDYGIGLKFHRMQTENSGEFTASFVDPTNGRPVVISILIEDKIRMSHIGPHFVYRVKLNDYGSNFLIGSSLGYLHYINDGHFGEPVYIEGSGIGLIADLNFDIALSTSVKFNLGASFLFNSLRSLEVNGSRVSLTNQEALDNSHLNLFCGLVFDIN